MDSDYSKRELDKYFMDINEKIDTNHKENHDAWIRTAESVEDLSKRVAIQNGRVGKLESKWNGVVIGGGVATFLVGLIISLVVYSFQVAMENQKNIILLEVRTQVESVLGQYVLEQ